MDVPSNVFDERVKPAFEFRFVEILVIETFGKTIWFVFCLNFVFVIRTFFVQFFVAFFRFFRHWNSTFWMISCPESKSPSLKYSTEQNFNIYSTYISAWYWWREQRNNNNNKCNYWWCKHRKMKIVDTTYECWSYNELKICFNWASLHLWFQLRPFKKLSSCGLLWSWMKLMNPAPEAHLKHLLNYRWDREPG